VEIVQDRLGIEAVAATSAHIPIDVLHANDQNASLRANTPVMLCSLQCVGRVGLAADVGEIQIVFSTPLASADAEYSPSWNVAPSQSRHPGCNSP
jgi:hypothetical protein